MKIVYKNKQRVKYSGHMAQSIKAIYLYALRGDIYGGYHGSAKTAYPCDFSNKKDVFGRECVEIRYKGSQQMIKTITLWGSDLWHIKNIRIKK